jgi:aldose 1-epimerase
MKKRFNGNNGDGGESMQVIQQPFGETNGRNVYTYTLKNNNGIEVTCLNYGCIITRIVTPDREGRAENIVLGFEQLEDYESNPAYFGAVVGRVAGRIKHASFELDGETYTLAANHNGHHLHGGLKGLSHVLWEAVPGEHETEASVQFSYTSADGEEGYPGTVELTVTYTLNDENEFMIRYEAESDRTTLLNVTNHTYFNLSGGLKRDILQHRLMIDSDRFAELDQELLPTGELLDVTGTPFDFREGRPIIEGVQSHHLQNELAGNGYDHPFVLNGHHQKEMVLIDGESGRKLTVETDEPSVVLYTGNHLPDTGAIYGVPSRKYMGLCLETQGLPDAIHHPHFPSCVLPKGKVFSSMTKYTFGVQ